MNKDEIAEIRSRSIREFFEHEEEQFTPWLQENIQKLTDDSLLGFELTDVEREVRIEGYQADLVAKNPNEERTVIIENQFGDGDSDHFGRALMYAANKNADVVVWVAEHIEEAYVDTLRMLNQRTDAEFGIYGVEVNVIQIGDSPPYGIDFTPVVTPEDWQPPESDLSSTERKQKQFWEAFREKLRNNDLDRFASRSARASASYHVNVQGISDTYIRPTTNYQKGRLYVVIRVYDDNVVGSDTIENSFTRYVEQAIQETDVQLDEDITKNIKFKETPDNHFDKITLDYDRENIDFDTREKWDEYQDWLIDVTQIFSRALESLIEEDQITH